MGRECFDRLSPQRPVKKDEKTLNSQTPFQMVAESLFYHQTAARLSGSPSNVENMHAMLQAEAAGAASSCLYTWLDPSVGENGRPTLARRQWNINSVLGGRSLRTRIPPTGRDYVRALHLLAMK